MTDAILKNISGMKHAAPVAQARAETLSDAIFFQDYVSQSRPLLIKGAVAHWPAARNWRDPDYLKKLCGHYEVLFFPHENHVTFKRMLDGQQDMTLAQALDRLHSPSLAVASLGLKQDFPEMRRDVGRFSFLTRAEPSFFYPPIRYFIYRNAGSAWHYHPFDETLMCQLVGGKRTGLLNCRGPFQQQLQQMFFREDYYEDPTQFAELEKAGLQFSVADVEEGDALYIPPLWWHGVSPLTDSFGVTAAVPWRSPPNVVADCIRRMAAGQVNLMGSTSSAQFEALLAMAGKLGLAKELSAAMERAHAIPVAL